ncbi:hypothetical protein DID88_000104 [Monilinia fructigena]|uniref:Uncharacterized protein n=1 Tax=Monilinia fructigena TaxID=38457 RepID=A0A395ILC9_9HELO|nr:hypothetical protein DID88_000104 [Monilinia fructigena]
MLIPSHLEKTSSEEGGALQRARYNFFIETYFSKVASQVTKAAVGKTLEEREQGAASVIDAIVKDIEPLVQDAAPFFGGSKEVDLCGGTSWIIPTSTLDFPQA